MDTIWTPRTMPCLDSYFGVRGRLFGRTCEVKKFLALSAQPLLIVLKSDDFGALHGYVWVLRWEAGVEPRLSGPPRARGKYPIRAPGQTGPWPGRSPSSLCPP